MAAQPVDNDTTAAQALSRASDIMSPVGPESPTAKENQQMDTGAADGDESFNLSDDSPISHRRLSSLRQHSSHQHPLHLQLVITHRRVKEQRIVLAPRLVESRQSWLRPSLVSSSTVWAVRQA